MTNGTGFTVNRYLIVTLLSLTLLGLPLQASDIFPKGVFSQEKKADKAAAVIATKYLAALGEGELKCSGANQQVYRFLLLPSYETPAMVKVVINESIVTVKTGLFPEHLPGTTPALKEFELPGSESAKLRRALEEAGFWRELTNQPMPEGLVVMDAPQWIIEACRSDHYKVVQRTPPDLPQDDAFAKLGLALLRAGRFDLDQLGVTNRSSTDCVKQ